MFRIRRQLIARADLTLAFVVLAFWLGAAGPLLTAARAERSVDGHEELLPINETAAERAARDEAARNARDAATARR